MENQKRSRGRPRKDVALRNDGPYLNVFASVGNSKDRSSYTTAGTPRILDFQELENLYQGNGFARRIIDLPASDMVRASFEIEGVEDCEPILAELEGINMMPKLCDAIKWSSLYGGALVVMLVNDGGMMEDALVHERAKSLEQLRVYDRHQVTRYKKYTDPSDMRFGGTELYMISPIEGSPYVVHESRCLVFDGVSVPDRTRAINDGWGASVLQQCADQLTRFGMSHIWANSLVERAQQAIHGIPDLTNTLRAPGGEALVRQRIDLVDMARSINNTVVIDAVESYDLKSTSLAGVPDLIDRFALALSAVTGIPESLLFGKATGGLTASGGNDLENWYSKVSQLQETILLHAVDKLCAIQMHIMGRYVEDYKIEFESLFMPSGKEKAEIDKLEADAKKVAADTANIYVTIGALDPSELRAYLASEGEYKIDDVPLMAEMPDVLLEPDAVAEDVVTAPTDKELAEIDYIRAKTEAIRKPAPATKQDATPFIIQPNIEIKQPNIDVRFDMPEIKIPEIKVNVEAAKIDAPVVNVHVPKQDAAIVNITNEVKSPAIEVKLPMRETVTTITRDADGEMTGSKAIEKDAE